jgi:hypothetical protein
MYTNTSERHDPNQQSIFGDGTTTASTPAPPNDPPVGSFDAYVIVTISVTTHGAPPRMRWGGRRAAVGG